MSIMLPLYVYPWPGVWNPLYWAAGNHTTLNFTVILNPCSGPCITTAPEQPYINEIPNLKAYPNIRTLGYVATNYTNKPIEAVIEEIDTYANWTRIMGNPKSAVDGIFFDETPGTYDWEKFVYMEKATKEVKRLEGLGQRIVVHNPGTIPGIYSNYLSLADITVIFEETYAHFLDAPNYNAIKALPSATNLPVSSFALMLHSVPNIPDDLLDWTVAQMKGMVGWGFVSSVATPGEYWHTFSSLFEPFVKRFAAPG